MMRTLITNARIVLPDRELPHAAMELQAEAISAIFPMGSNVAAEEVVSQDVAFLDFGGDVIVPGLVDLHVHGCFGSDVMDADPDSMLRMSQGLLRGGTTAFLATTMTAPTEKLDEVLAATAKWQPAENGAEFLGMHLEGPCISQAYRGAQNMGMVSGLTPPAPDRVKVLTLAPELPQAPGWMAWAKRAGIVISAGHSGASYEQMQTAIEGGVRQVTHAFNAMPGIHHRTPGLLTAALLDDRVVIELIADGIHIHPAVLELAFRLKGPDKAILVSDGTRAVGMSDGEYDLGGQQVLLLGGRMTLKDGTIAGSAATLLEGVAFVSGVVKRPLYEAVRMASLNPALILGVADRVGSLEVGKEATFLRLTPELQLKEVWVRGSLVFPDIRALLLKNRD